MGRSCQRSTGRAEPEEKSRILPGFLPHAIGREDYRAGHIPGAISIPFDELAARLAELPDDQEIVAYFRGIFRTVISPNVLPPNHFPAGVDRQELVRMTSCWVARVIAT
jgi:hypothetical protein